MTTDPERPSVMADGPGDLAEALPYLFPIYPSNRIALIAMNGPRSVLGVRMAAPIPHIHDGWQSTASETAAHFVRHAETSGQRPDSVIVFLCREPDTDQTGADVAEDLRSLHETLSGAFAELGVPVWESLCVSEGRWWSYQCSCSRCTTSQGTPVRSPDTPGPVVTAATYAGIAPAPRPETITATFQPLHGEAAEEQLRGLHAQQQLMTRQLEDGDRAALQEEISDLVDATMATFREGTEDLDSVTAARLVLGLADRAVRDRAMEHCGPDDLLHAMRLWRDLISRCIPPYEAYTVAPLTLLGWAAWCADDLATARVAIQKALELDPTYTMADLLLKSLNRGLSAEPLRQSVRQERQQRTERCASAAC